MPLRDSGAEQPFDRLTRLATRALDVPIALVTELDNVRQVFRGQSGLPKPWAERRESPLSHSFCRHVVASGEPLVIQDAREHPLVNGSPAIEEWGAIAYAGIPLEGEGGEVLGALCAIDSRPRIWTDDDMEILSDLAETAVAELERRSAANREFPFRSLVEATSEIIWRTDAGGLAVGGQTAWADYTGQAVDEAVGWGWLQAVHPEDREETATAWSAAVEARTLFRTEHRVRRSDGEFRVFAVRGVPVPAPDGSVQEWIGMHTDITEQRRGEQEREFLAEASRVLSSSLDYEVTLAAIARLAVNGVADWCGVYLRDAEGVRRVAIAHADPAKEAIAQELLRFPVDANAPAGPPLAIRTGESSLRQIDEEFLHDVSHNAGHLRIIRELGMRSAIDVPLIARGRTLGAISLVSAESARLYGPRDVELAEELARRAALAVDQARLFQQTVNDRDRLEGLTGELELQMKEVQNQAMQLKEHQTELQMANAELRRAETHYRRLVETSPIGVFVLDGQGQFVEINTTGARILDRTPAEVLGHHFGAVVAAEDLGAAGGVYARVMSGEAETAEIELRVCRPSGELRLESVAITAVREGEAIVGVHGVCRDITDERRTQDALQESETTFRSLFDSLTELVYIQDLEGRFLSINDAVVKRYGYRRDEILGGTPDLLIDPERSHMNEVRERFGGAVQGRIQQFEFWGRTRTGESFPKEMTLSRGRYFGQEVVVAVARDITERKEAEDRLREHEARAHVSRAAELERERLSALFEQAPYFIALVMGPEHVYATINERYVQMVGRDDILHKPIREALPELEGQGYIELLDRVYRTGEPYVGESSPVTLRRKTDAEPEERYVNFVYQPFLGPDGTVSGIFMHGVDVTDLVRARQEAERANQAKSDFLSRMSHELRTPLNAILGFGQLLEMDVETEDARESVDQILRGGRHLLTLIDEVLDIARIEAGRGSLEVEPVAVRETLDESVSLLRPTAAQQGITVRTRDSRRSDLFVYADRQRLKQVLLNLLSNAIKYNRHRGEVTLSCEVIEGDRLRIIVLDTGFGISADNLARLFVPFERLDAERSGIPGSGLGLSLSRGLVDAMGGTLGVESTEGKGSRFWVELPLVPTPPGADPVAPVAIDATEVPAPEKTVLFIEDNLANVRLVERVIERRPGLLRLLTAMQGSLGLDLAREHRPDLILLDLNLPDIPGDRVLIELRNDPALRQIPVVVVSGDAIPAQIERLLELGARAYITKPFDVQELLQTIENCLDETRSERAGAG